MGRPPPIGRGRLTRPRADGRAGGAGRAEATPPGGGPRRGHVAQASAARLISRAAHGPPRALLRAVRAATLFRCLLRDSPPRRARGRAPLGQVRGARRRPRGQRWGAGRPSPPQPLPPGSGTAFHMGRWPDDLSLEMGAAPLTLGGSGHRSPLSRRTPVTCPGSVSSKLTGSGKLLDRTGQRFGVRAEGRCERSRAGSAALGGPSHPTAPDCSRCAPLRVCAAPQPASVPRDCGVGCGFPRLPGGAVFLDVRR